MALTLRVGLFGVTEGDFSWTPAQIAQWAQALFRLTGIGGVRWGQSRVPRGDRRVWKYRQPPHSLRGLSGHTLRPGAVLMLTTCQAQS